MSLDNKIAILKKLPFAKSWQNNYVSDVHNILDINTGELKKTELNDFIFLPAASALKNFSNDREFLSFRNEHKGDGMMDFKLLENKIDNENHRIVLLYLAIILAEMKIFFMIDHKYGIFIEISELHEKADSLGEGYKALYRHFSIPKTIAHKNGIVETWVS
jgi:hypothetical protein